MDGFGIFYSGGVGVEGVLSGLQGCAVQGVRMQNSTMAPIFLSLTAIAYRQQVTTEAGV